MKILFHKTLPFLLAQKEKSKLFVFCSLRRPVEPAVLILSQIKIKKDLKAFFIFMAEARGFEPPIRFPAYTRSRRAP